MAVEVHVEGRIAHRRLVDFGTAVRRYAEYARDHGYGEPKILLGLSGFMNTVRLVYCYPDLGQYERDVRTILERTRSSAATPASIRENSSSMAATMRACSAAGGKGIGHGRRIVWLMFCCVAPFPWRARARRWNNR
jgi:hypothetical protein